jgi:DMSO/TMAO reductase YedYZ molybdopterin-dependent catalytic subunit
MLGLAMALCASPCRAAGLLSDELIVAGAVKAELRLTVTDLRAFPTDQLATVSSTRRVDDKETASSVRGVRLTAVLERAGLLATDQNDWKHTVVLATASDGYRVAFSWPELFNREAGSAVLVVFERDGQPLGDREGRIALVAGRDLRTGPRSVHWLTRLDVRVLKE